MDNAINERFLSKDSQSVKRVALLGSTGSVGRSTLDVIARYPEHLQLSTIAARTRIESLAEQIHRFNPALAVVWDEEKAQALRGLNGHCEVRSGLQGLIDAATHPDVDVVVMATSGPDALIPLVRAIEAGKSIALASKELLVMAGGIIMSLVKRHGVSLVPIDSEHAALLQCLQGVRRQDIARLVITGSGGSLWQMSPEQRAVASREKVLAHPKWQMGAKITVDSATLMNKGLEVIEAQWLFGLPYERFRVLIHPEALIHALIELVDGSVLAQMSPCDMRLPIQYALSYPQRWSSTLPKLSLTEAGALRFFEPDLEQFPCLRLSLHAAQIGGSLCTVLNAANETAVLAFLDGQIMLGDISGIIAETLEKHTLITEPTLEEVLSADQWARRNALESIHQWSLR